VSSSYCFFHKLVADPKYLSMFQHLAFLCIWTFLFTVLSCVRSHSLNKFDIKGVWEIKRIENTNLGTRCLSFSLGDAYVYFSDSTGFFDTGLNRGGDTTLIDFKLKIFEDMVSIEGDKGVFGIFHVIIFNENQIELYSSSSGATLFLERFAEELNFGDEIRSFSLSASPISYYCSNYEFFCSKVGEMVFNRNGEVKKGSVGGDDIYLKQIFTLINKSVVNPQMEVEIDSIFQTHVRSYKFLVSFKSGIEKEFEFDEKTIPLEFKKMVVFSDKYFYKMFDRD
jgi:hypothetical protein